MRLISAYIKNFGKISETKIDLNSNIVSYCEENGYGKTTLAVFIRAMLFGMEKNSSKELVDREHYYPYNGGVYGGVLEVEYNQKIIKIDRVFDKKNPNNDEVKVYDQYGNDLKWNKDTIGNKIFDIDANSFNKTLFLSANDLSFENTNSISQKLNGIVNEDLVSYEDIIEEIDKKLKTIKRDDNRGKNVIINTLNGNINSNEKKIRDYRSIEVTLQSDYAKLNKLENELKKSSDIKTSIANQKVIKEKWNQYQIKNKELEELNNNLELVKERYPKGIISNYHLRLLEDYKNKDYALLTKLNLYNLNNEEEKDLNLLKDKYNQVILDEDLVNLKKCKLEGDSLKNQNNRLIFSEEKKNLLEELKKTFKEGIPLETDLNNYQNKITRHEELKLELAIKKEESLSVKSLIRLFDEGVPLDNELNDIEDKVQKLKELVAYKDSYVDSIYNSVPFNKKSNLNIILLVLGLISLIGGIFLLNVDTYISIIFFILGAILIILGFFFKKNKVINNHQIINSSLVENNKKIDLLKQDLRVFFAKYRLASEDFEASLSKLKMDIKDYNLYLKGQEKNNELRNSLMIEKENLFKEIQDYFLKYNCYEDNLYKSLSNLRNKIANYQALVNEYINYSKSMNNSTSSLKELEVLKNKIYSKYNLDLSLTLNDELINTLESDNKRFKNYLEKKKLYQETLKEKEVNNEEIKKVLSDYNLSLEEDYQTEFNNLKNDYELINNYEESIKKKKFEIQNYKEENNLNDEVIEDDLLNLTYEDADKINENLNMEITRLKDQISEKEEQVEKINTLENENEKYQEEIAKYEKKYQNLLLTKKFFEKAQNNLHNKYIGPMEKSFIDYSNKINKFISKDAKINFKFDVNYLEGSKNHLSEGQKTCLALCMRLAVIDNMYKEEKPFIILDDPFIYLDANNIKNSLEVLNELSKDIQIIYFSCHPSRDIKTI